MKRICIVTWFGSGNYGTTLQSFALHKKLKDLGYNVNILKEFNLSHKRQNYFRYILNILGLLSFAKLLKASKSKKNYRLKKFIAKNYNVKEIYTSRQYTNLLNKTDVFITGSDQIWNAQSNFNPFYFLNFAKNNKRIAYASSIGTSTFPDKYKNQIKLLLNKFSYIAVREESAIQTINSLLERNICIQVADPTFLLTCQEWKEIASKSKIKNLPSNYILCYLIGNNDFYITQIKIIKEKFGINNIIIIPSLENPNFYVQDAIIYNETGPQEFIYLIEHAKLVCTDSFHATAISINLSVDFIELKRFKDTDKASQNSRIYDLLKHYKLDFRLYDETHFSWIRPIDYNIVKNIVTQDRKQSMDYLINAIENK